MTSPTPYLTTHLAAIDLPDPAIITAVTAAKSGDDAAMQTVIAATIRHIVKQAVRYHRPELIDDLIQEGIVGVMTAVDKFNPAKSSGASFLTYASYWVRWRMTEYAYRSKIVFIPQRKRGVGNRVTAIWLDSASPDDPDGRTLHESLADAEDAAPDAIYRDRTDKAAVVGLLDAIPACEREAITAVMGLGGGAKSTLTEVAKATSTTHQVVHQRVGRGLWKIRRMIEKGASR